MGVNSRGLGGGCGDFWLWRGAAAGRRRHQLVCAALQQVLPVVVGHVVLVSRLMAVQVVGAVVILPIFNTGRPISTN
jgi:hypothetical protein